MKLFSGRQWHRNWRLLLLRRRRTRSRSEHILRSIALERQKAKPYRLRLRLLRRGNRSFENVDLSWGQCRQSNGKIKKIKVDSDTRWISRFARRHWYEKLSDTKHLTLCIDKMDKNNNVLCMLQTLFGKILTKCC